jgi:hypothetical protein
MEKKTSYHKEDNILSKTAVAIFSVLLVTFSVTSMQTIAMNNNNQGVALVQEANAQVDQDIDQEGDCNDDGICIASQSAAFTNINDNGDESEKVEQDILQILNCGDSDCEQFGSPESTLDATQSVDVDSLENSRVDFDVDMEIKQESDGEGQDNMFQNNFGTQLFRVLAEDTSTVDADGDGKDVRFTMTQTNDECDDSSCNNYADQSYEIFAANTGKTILDHNSGFNVIQTNNGCDDDDGDTDIDCINDSDQGLKITNHGTGTVFYDSKDPDDDTNDVIQTNNCDFGEFDCINDANTFVSIEAIQNSKVNFDDVVQDVNQNNNCDDLNTAKYSTIGCGNSLDMALNIFSKDDGFVTHEGDNPTHVQEAVQKNECDDAGCVNKGGMYVNIGTGANGPITGTLKTDYTQKLSQSNYCSDEAQCKNQAQLVYNAFAGGSAVLTSVSNQYVTQSNTCSNGVSCTNIGLVTNNVFADNTAKLTATANQKLTQSCNTSSSSCLNDNTVTTSGTAINNAVLSYTTNQDINTADPNGAANINIVRNSGTTNLGTITQTSNGNLNP